MLVCYIFRLQVNNCDCKVYVVTHIVTLKVVNYTHTCLLATSRAMYSLKTKLNHKRKYGTNGGSCSLTYSVIALGFLDVSNVGVPVKRHFLYVNHLYWSSRCFSVIAAHVHLSVLNY